MAYDQHPTIEHGSTKGDRWLQAHSIPLALGIAVVEGILVLAGGLRLWAVVAVAVAVVALYFYGRDRLSGDARAIARVIALSQTFVVVVPLLAGVIFALSVVALLLLVAAALLIILRDRKR